MKNTILFLLLILGATTTQAQVLVKMSPKAEKPKASPAKPKTVVKTKIVYRDNPSTITQPATKIIYVEKPAITQPEYLSSKIFHYSERQGKGFFKKIGFKSWGEFDVSTSNKIFTFSSIEETDLYILLYDESRKFYVKLTENACLWGYESDQIKYKVHDGYWTIQ
jgi:hypothetical protein